MRAFVANQQLANIWPHRFGPLGGVEWSCERFSRGGGERDVVLKHSRRSQGP